MDEARGIIEIVEVFLTFSGLKPNGQVVYLIIGQSVGRYRSNEPQRLFQAPLPQAPLALLLP
jgi:hypothetical protein